MQTTLFIRLGVDAQDEVCWLSRNAQGASAPRRGALREAALRAQGERVTVLLPALPLLPLSANLPPMQGQKLRRAVPYAVEEQLAEDVESYHFALGKRGAEGVLPLLAVGREQMAAWQRCFAEVELKPHACYDEAQLLPWLPGEVSLLLEPDGALLRLSAHEAYSLPAEGLDPLLDMALEGLEEVTALRIFDARGEGAETPIWRGAAALLEQHYEQINEPLSLLSGGVNGATINLLQGTFSRREQLGKLWRPWRATAALLAVWLLLMGGEAIIDYRRLVAEEERSYRAVEQVYRDAFPESKNVVNPRVQMEQKLKELSGGGSGGAFVGLLDASGPVIGEAKGVELRNLRYRQGELELELQLADLPALDALKEALQQRGLEVEIRNATSRNDSVEGRLAIRGAGK